LTALTPSQLTVLNAISSQAFYVFDVPTINQNLPAYGQLPEGGKWYFSYDSANPNFTGTIQALAGSSLTDAVLTTASSVPFMAVENPLTYPIYVVDMSGYKNMYSLKAYGDYASDFNQNSNLYNFLINTHHVEATGSAVDSYVRVAEPQAVYVFNKIDNDGMLAADLRNGRLVNPMTGVALDVYANFMLYDSPDYYYFSGPIENPIFSDTTTYNVGVMGSGTLAIANNPLAGAPYWKLAIERAPFADMPVDDSLFVYGSYASIPNSADFINPAKTGTYIGYPASGEGILMESYLNVATDALSHNYYTGSVTTGRVVDDNGLNKIVAKHFDMLGGITTTGVANAGGYTSNQYLFNENGQYINADIGGLDNDKGNTSDKYNWIVGEVLYDGVAVNVGLMKKVTDQSDSNLFQHIWGYTPSSLPMSGFMIGSDTLLNTWMGDIIAMDTATSSSGELAIGAVSDDLGIATHKSMSGLSQGASSVSVASASFLGEDLQAMIVESKTVNGKTYDFAMATLPDYVVVDGDVKYSYIDDYSSWGYWMAREQGAVADSFAQGYWVGGYETPSATIAAISVNTQYDYYGQALGNLTDGVQIAPIKLDGDNIFNLSVKFGTSKPVQITQIKFNTVGLGSVDTGVLSANFGSGLPSAITGSNFSAVAIGGDVTNMNIKGKFYGPGAESVGGAWAGSFNNGAALSGTGVFKAKRYIGMP
ncbi:MAG TPA: hypothetical protein PLV58_09595, partial [Campylobacterales bacterium]|nr:hypothetical protein [Campylobacterales bacterium]